LGVVRPLQLRLDMRNSAPLAALVLGALGVLAGPVHADRARHKTAHASRDVAGPVTARAERTAALTTGSIAITGASRRDVPAAAIDPAAAPAPTRKPSHLSTVDVSSLVAPYASDIERCYVGTVGEVRRTAQLDLMFVIAREGHVLSVDIGAPSASPRATLSLASCIRTAVSSLHFPERRNDTTAIIPYAFQRTEAPNAGPQLSCWNPKGC
jgi:hypothetical protein